MTEPYAYNQPPYADYPTLFPMPESEMPESHEELHRDNREFVEALLPPESAEEGYTEYDFMVLEACAAALTATDLRFGRHIGELGTMAAENEHDGLWVTLPTFYHNGDGTRLAMLGSKSYMDFINALEGVKSPFANRLAYSTTLLTAAFDDLVFGKYDRGQDELQSLRLATAYLTAHGFPQQVVDEVAIGIRASTFNEETGAQSIDSDAGALEVQIGSTVGDLWAAGTPIGTAYLFPLGAENLWKRDTARRYGQQLRKAAIELALDRPGGWHGETLEDFFHVIERNPNVKQTLGLMFIENRKFLLEQHKYPDRRIDMLMQPGKIQNARLQELIGQAMLQGWSMWRAFHCALSYAEAGAWRRGERENVALSPNITPELVSRILLTPRTAVAELIAPVDADAFFEQYKTEVFSAGE